MIVHTATLAGGDNNQDRVLVTDQAVIMLDGATAFEPQDIDAGLYAATLGASIADQLVTEPSSPLSDVVAQAIAHTTKLLGLTADNSPTSTVSILRERPDAIDLFVLGDSPVHYGTGATGHFLTDQRLAGIARRERRVYTDRLLAGHGYDDAHRRAVIELQSAQRRARNTNAGYWIAANDSEAAHHALRRTIEPSHIDWAVLATDGAANLIDHIGRRWSDTARRESTALRQLLNEIHYWENHDDPDGTQLPRAKRHDDKTIAVVLPSRPL